MSLGKKARVSSVSAPKPKPKGKGKAKAAPPPRRSSSSSSSGSDDDEEDEDDDKAAMLAALEARGREMFGFSMPAESSAQAAARGESDDSEADDDEYHTDDGWGADGDFVTDSEDEFGKAAAPEPPKAKVPEVVFAPTGGAAASFSKAEKRAFLTGNSAKMMGLKREDEGPRKKRKVEDDEEQSNQRLDKTLHDMLLTTLLPGAAADNASRPVEKRNAMAGRLLELANYSLPGEGAAASKAKNLSSHPAKVRTGLLHAQQKRADLQRADAEAAGSWVKGVGGLGDMGKKGAGKRKQVDREVREFGMETGKKKGMAGTKRERAKGLGMGVGRFVGGTLKISEREIERVNNIGKSRPRKGGKKTMKGW